MAQIAPGSIRPLIRAEYDHPVELGSFENKRIELLHGTLVYHESARISSCGVYCALDRNVGSSRVVIHREPKNGLHTSTKYQRPGDFVSLVQFPDVRIDIGSVLP